MNAIQTKGRRELIAEVIFYLAFFTELFIMIIDKSNYALPIEGRLFQMTFLLFGIKVLMTRYSYREWIAIFAFGILGTICYITTDRNDIIRIVMFVIAAKGIKPRRIMEVGFYATLAGVLIIMTLSVTGIYGVISMEGDFRGTGIMTRYCLGLGHPNALHCMIWILIVFVIYLYVDKMKWYHFVILLAINQFFYLLTDSRTGVLIGVLTIVMGAVFRYVKTLREQKWIYIIGAIGVVFCVIFSIVSIYYGHDITIFEKIDRFVTGRIQLSHDIANISQWSLFSNMQNIAHQDMGLVRIFFWYGYIPSIIYFILLLFMVKDSYVKKDYPMFIVITTFVIYHVFESHAVSVYIPRNLTLLLLAGCWNTMLHLNNENEKFVWELVMLPKK